MLGLAILFGLAIWVAITVGAIWLGIKLAKKISQKTYAKYVGGFLGFMLTMGGFIVYWTIEYYSIKHKLDYLCKTEAGIKIYVTPEEWRNKVGDKYWLILKPYTNEELFKSKPKLKSILYNNREYSYENNAYRTGNLENERVAVYWSSKNMGDRLIDFQSILIDKSNRNILVREIDFSVTKVTVANEISGLKFWLNNLKDCSENNSQKFYQIVSQYSNQKVVGVSNE
jgi:hypothetical protein